MMEIQEMELFSIYSLTDYREMEIMYDENNIVKSIYLGYVNPE